MPQLPSIRGGALLEFTRVIPPRDRLIVALDVPTAQAAGEIVRELGDFVSFYKVGLQLFTAEGPTFVRELTASGHKVFLDLKLPLKSGHEVLAWIRDQKEFESTVVVVLTSSDEPSDVSRCYKLGANSYLVKPPTADQLLDLAKAFKWYWLHHNRFDTAAA